MAGEKKELNDEIRCNPDTMMLQLSPTRFVTSSLYNGQRMIHIREFYNVGNRLYPKKGKGLAFTLTQWATFLTYKEDIDKKINNMNNVLNVYKHIGSNKYVSVNDGYNFVDLRLFWIPLNEEGVHPTRKGISLTFCEWRQLTYVMDTLPLFIPEIEITVPCMLRDDHTNVLGFMQCLNCNPNTALFD
jgi:hypothetical protein